MNVRGLRDDSFVIFSRLASPNPARRAIIAVMQTRRRTIGYVLLLMLAMIPAWAPLTRPGLPQWLPGSLPVFKLYALERGEAFDVGWVLDSGFAYGVARLFRFIGLDGVTALKISLILGVSLLGIVLFFWARHLWGDRAGVLAALLVLYAPVFLSSLYILGGIAGVWLMLGVSLLGWGLSLKKWQRWVVALAGAGLVLLNATFLFKTPLALTSISFFQLFEYPWALGATSIALQTPPAWTPGLPMLALALIAVWLSWSREKIEGRSVSLILMGTGLVALLAALIVPGDLALTLILAGSLVLAVGAAGLLVFAPVLQRPGIWAALLILPVLAAGPALSPDFQSYPIPQSPAGVFGEQQILLIDIDMPTPATPGRPLTLNAHWQATHPIDFDYNIFIHVTDDAGDLIAQFDGQPQHGDRPMTTWLVGEVLPDSYQIDIPADAPDSLHVTMGVYNWQTLERLPLASGGDALTIGN